MLALMAELKLRGTMKDLAAEIGLTHESLYRTLAGLEHSGEIRRKNRNITVEARMIQIICGLLFPRYQKLGADRERGSEMSRYSWKTMLAVSALIGVTTYAFAQMRSDGPGGIRDRMQEMHRQMMPGKGRMPSNGMTDHDRMHNPQLGSSPTLPGQDAFGAIQEIVRILEADPKTDWSKVNIEALRQHLIDMNEVTLHAAAVQRDLSDGIEIAVTGEGRTLDAIKRMIPAHIAVLRELGWTVKIEELSNGIKLTVMATETQSLTKLRALGFMGILVQGSHHQPHHLMMALGQHVH
jgi:hypothetical protein